MQQWITRRFDLQGHGTTIRTEVLAGLTTFLAAAYIIFVQPTVLSAAGMDFGAVMTATCLASALATLLMAMLANYPIAVAPAMGHNFFFAYTLVLGMKVPWPTALGAVALAGILFIATAGIGLRERLISALPTSLQHAIAAGIGLLVAMIGLQWSGLIVAAPGTLVGLGKLGAPPTLLALFGLVLTSVLVARRVRGALLAGMTATAVVGIAVGLVRFHGLVSAPPSLAPTFFALDIAGALAPAVLPAVIIFFFLALFDSVGTLVGVAGRAGLLEGGRLPRARQALLADAIGTVAGATLGTSTVTAYIESATGVAEGGRTGLASIVTAACFLLSLAFAPLVQTIGGGYDAGGGSVLYPVVAPALLVVGVLMLQEVRHVAWDDPTEAIPSFLTLVIMPLTVSITEGIAFGFVAICVLKLATGRQREVHWLIYVFAVLFVARYVWLR
jgi:AGZA family xanthine/uracil permease-like MFS transporter